MEYEDFLKNKLISFESVGFEHDRSKLNHNAFEWQSDIVIWALKKGKAALFEDCGMGKTLQELMWSKAVIEHTGKPVLIITPLAVAHQTMLESEKFDIGIETKVCRTQEDVIDGINITNYEMLEHFDESVFGGIVLDESSILKHFDSKTKCLIIDKFKYTDYKLSCTATPSPNDYMELGNQAEFLGVMTRGEMLATFFVHDGGDTSHWRLKGHAEDKFWEWVASWAVVIEKPSDLGYSDDEYILPELKMFEHSVHSNNLESRDGQMKLFADVVMTLQERREARRDSLTERCKKAAEIISQNPNEQWILWCDLNAEADELKRQIPNAIEVRGTDTPEYKTKYLHGFSAGEVQILISKPSVAGWGLNWQKCHNMIFVGLSDSYEMMYQAIRRCYRFGQENAVNVHIVISEQEGAVKDNIERKDELARKMKSEMVKHTKKILEKEIRGTYHEVMEYNPTIEMIIPSWLVSA